VVNKLLSIVPFELWTNKRHKTNLVISLNIKKHPILFVTAHVPYMATSAGGPAPEK